MRQDEFVGLDRSVDEFRRWVLSDWTSPTTRALLAEYFVRCALGCENELPQDWDYVDIILKSGKTIEIKASAFLQPAGDGELKETIPSFDIKEKKWAWSNELWGWKPPSEPPKRWADCYVFCLVNMESREAYNPLDVSQWEFFVLPTSRINETLGRQKTVAVGRLQQEGFRSVTFSGLAAGTSLALQS